MSGERTYTISEVAGGIEAAIEQAFPEEFWVVGEIQGLDRSRHGKHWYFQLCETRGEGEVYRLSATLWNRVRDRLFGPTGKLKGVMNLDEPLDGIKIRALCRLDFYAPYGKISLHVEDIDPAYTLGDLEARRQALIEKLTKQDLLHRNQERVLAELPLRLGLITSAGSAAYNDFMKEIEKSGIGFRILVFDARMQGEEAVPTIRAGFAALQRLEPDAIVLIRGGGSRLDLSWFDREEVVRNIIQCGLPVITGIGHEIDVTVAEMTAHTGLKTPTAAAAFLVDRVRDYLEASVELTLNVAKAAERRIELEAMAFSKLACDIAYRVNLALMEAQGLLAEGPRRLSSAIDLLLERAGTALGQAGSRLAAGRHVRRFEAMGLELIRAATGLGHQGLRHLEREEHLIDLHSERLRLLDPVRTVQRGYAVLTDEKGKAIKSVAALAVKDRIHAVLRDGRIAASVEEIEKEGGHGSKEKRQLEIW
jgi:exodeoxyribonuclease VII large subunit